ncbi:hypothetical protein [Sphingobacterium faecium]|uniref:hypothetical protein n=1 Tax=Sphingobacterium faecium TaxID=34087 RepID=UPI001291059A|nr:hypothetical protein [Sphingobacterium faecium]
MFNTLTLFLILFTAGSATVLTPVIFGAIYFDHDHTRFVKVRKDRDIGLKRLLNKMMV